MTGVVVTKGYLQCDKSRAHAPHHLECAFYGLPELEVAETLESGYRVREAVIGLEELLRVTDVKCLEVRHAP